ncbi:hypothetical protein GCM10009616_28970 [Microlunatus lacustris]
MSSLLALLVAAVLLLAAALILAAVALLRYRAAERVLTADVVWLVGAAPGSRVPDGEADVAARYLVRHRQHRLVGGLLGVGFAVVVGLRWYQSVGFGFAQRSPLADVLFCGVAGVLVGALLAETYRLRPAPGPRTTVLEPRPAAPHARTVQAARLVLAAALLAGLLLLLAGSGSAALTSAAAGTLLVGVAELTRRRIVDRRRPVRAERVDRLDQQLRVFAATSVARLELAAAVLTAMWVLAWWQAATPQPPVVLDVLAGVGGIAGLVVVVVFLLRAAPRAPRRAQVAA